jgi:hypothetical protein
MNATFRAHPQVAQEQCAAPPARPYLERSCRYVTDRRSDRTTQEDDVQPVLIVMTEGVPPYQAVDTRGEIFGLVVREPRV